MKFPLKFIYTLKGNVKKVSRRLKKAYPYQTICLSFGSSVSAALHDFEAFLLTLKQLDNQNTIRLLKKVSDVKIFANPDN